MKYIKLFESWLSEQEEGKSMVTMEDTETSSSAPFDPKAPWLTAVRDMKVGNFASAVGGLGVLKGDSLEDWAYPQSEGMSAEDREKVGSSILDNVYGRAANGGSDRKAMWIKGEFGDSLFSDYENGKGRTLYYMNQQAGGKHFIEIDGKVCTFEFKAPGKEELGEHLFDAKGTIRAASGATSIHDHSLVKPGEVFKMVEILEDPEYQGKGENGKFEFKIEGTLGQMLVFAMTNDFAATKKNISSKEILTKYFSNEKETEYLSKTLFGIPFKQAFNWNSIFIAPKKGEAKYIGQINFEYNSADLKNEKVTNTTLDNLIKFINKEKPKTVTIVGHTDGKGSQRYNQPLSERRAKSIEKYLDSKSAEIPKGIKITAVGKGKLEPIKNDRGGTLKDYAAANRRVEILFDGVEKTDYMSTLKNLDED